MTWRLIGYLCGTAFMTGQLGACAQASGMAPGPQVEAQRGHTQCPLAGRDQRTLVFDTPGQWRAAVTMDEVQALGRKVDWERERVLLHALERQATLGVRVAAIGMSNTGTRLSPQLDLRITRPAPDAGAMTALSRPCVVVALTRGPWREVRVADDDGHVLATGRLQAAGTATGDGDASPTPSAPVPQKGLIQPHSSPPSR